MMDKKEDVVLIELTGVSKIYRAGDRECRALDNISAQIEKGRFTAITGKSGSGKTTLLNLMGLLDRPDEGHILVDGKDLTRLCKKDILEYRRTGVGIVFQFFYLIPALTARDNIRIANECAPKYKTTYLDELADQLDIRNLMDKYPGQLSGGEKQRVAIARALINRPKLLLADEPTGNLDSENSERVVDLLQRLTREQGITLIMVTHDDEIAGRADRVLRLSDGRIVEDNGKEGAACGEN